MAAELAAIEEQVWRASEGNPFVAVETVRALRHERGSRSERTLLPSRVHDLIAERLARLGEPSRQLRHPRVFPTRVGMDRKTGRLGHRCPPCSHERGGRVRPAPNLVERGPREPRRDAATHQVFQPAVLRVESAEMRTTGRPGSRSRRPACRGLTLRVSERRHGSPGAGSPRGRKGYPGKPECARVGPRRARNGHDHPVAENSAPRNRLKTMVGRDGIEPPTPGFSVLCSTN